MSAEAPVPAASAERSRRTSLDSALGVVSGAFGGALGHAWNGVHLHLVADPRRRPARIPFALLMVALLGAGLVGLLLLNTSLQQGAFAAHELEARNARLAERHQALSEELAELESPGSLAARAAALGMVDNPQPVFLRLPDGAVLGKPVVARRAR